ncbi:MAG: hypothetical protein ACEQSX_02725 [Baekduiaceae bacterium]
MHRERSTHTPSSHAGDAAGIRSALARKLRELEPEIVGLSGTWQDVREFAARLTDDPDGLMSDVAAEFDEWFDDTDAIDGTADEVGVDPRVLRSAVEQILPNALAPDAMLAALAQCWVRPTPAEHLVETTTRLAAHKAQMLRRWAACELVDEWHPGVRLRRELEALPEYELPAEYRGDDLAQRVERQWPASDGAAWVDSLASTIHHEWPSAAQHVTHADVDAALVAWRRHGWTRPPAPEDALSVAAGDASPQVPTRALRAEWLRTRRQRGDACTDLVQYACEVAARRERHAPRRQASAVRRSGAARARGRRTRTAQLRAAGSRSGSDPGDDDGPSDPDPPEQRGAHR